MQSEPDSITVYTAAHGSEPIEYKRSLRSSNPHKYPGNFKVLFLSFAGLANVTTEMGLIAQGKGKLAKKLRDKGSDYGILAVLAPMIFKAWAEGREHDSKYDLRDAKTVMDVLLEEIMKQGKELANLKYSETSPPVIVENPQFDKRWWFADNAGDNLRKHSDRSGISRDAGETKYNPIIAIPGLFVLQTSRPELKWWSLSDIKGLDEHTSDGFLTMLAVKNRNLLRKINYTSFWKIYIDGFDFSNIPDIDVLELGNITEAVIILTQFYYAVNSGNGIDDPNDEAEIAGFVDEEGEAAGEAAAAGAAAAAGQDTLQLTKEIKDRLKSIFVHSSHATKAIQLVKDAKGEVESIRNIFMTKAKDADDLEEKIEQMQDDTLTRSKGATLGSMTDTLRLADEQLGRLRIKFTNQKRDAAERESELDVIKGNIVANITGLIRYILGSSEVGPAVKAAIKNIIMRNKLKNILKMGILYKVLTLQQVIIFFRGLENNILNIVDPSCFVLRKKDSPLEVPGTPQLPDSQQGMQCEVHAHNPQWNEKLAELVAAAATEAAAAAAKRRKPNEGGGTKRKKSMRSYSRKRRTHRKHRTHRKRRATRRYRRIRN
jgi:hypothetical protein